MAQPFVEPCGAGVIAAEPCPRELGREVSPGRRRMVLADEIGARAMLIAGPAGPAAAYVWLAFGRDASLLYGVIGPMALLGVSFAVLVAPLTAAVMSIVDRAGEGARLRHQQRDEPSCAAAGIALAAGLAPFPSGYEIALAIAAAVSLAGALVVAATVPRTVA